MCVSVKGFHEKCTANRRLPSIKQKPNETNTAHLRVAVPGKAAQYSLHEPKSGWFILTHTNVNGKGYLYTRHQTTYQGSH